MVQCNIDIEDGVQVDNSSEIDVINKTNGFHLNPSHPDKESDTGSMMSKYKIDLMFTINKKDGKRIDNNDDNNIERDNIKIENKVQEKIDEMFKEVALNDMIKNFHVDYLGSIQINDDKVQSLETLQEPLKKLYVLYKKDRQLKINNNKSILKITKNGLKLNYGNQLEQINSFNTICVWASVKLITRPHGMNKKFGLEYCFLPLVSDYKNNNIKFIKLNQNETYLFPNNNTYEDNVPIFVIVMKKIKLLEVHAFICNSNEDAINIAANLYKTLLLTNKNNNKIKQKNGLTSCVSVNDSITGSLSKNSQVINQKTSSVGSIHRKYSKQNGLQIDRKSTDGSIHEISNTTQNDSVSNSRNERQNKITCRSDFEKRLIKEHDRIERYSVSSRCSRQDRNNSRMNETPDVRSSSVESVRNYVVDPYKRKEKQREGQNSKLHLSNRSESVESVRHYVDYVSEAVKNRKSSLIGVERSSRKHRSNSVESVKDYDIQGNHRRKYSDNINRYNSIESISHGHHGSRRKERRASSESLRKNLRANSVESILNYNKITEHGQQQMDQCPELPFPKRKSSNNSTKSINLQSIDFFKNLQLSNDVFYERKAKQKPIYEIDKGSRRHSSDNAHVTNSKINSNGPNEIDNAERNSRSRSSSVNYLNTSTSGIHSMTEFDVRDINMRRRNSTNQSSRKRHGKNIENHRKDSFTNDTVARKIKNRENENKNDIDICNTNKSGDIFTRVAIPRSTSFLKTNSSLRNSLNYSMKNYEARKLSSCKLGLNDIFLELKNQEGLNNLDDILNVIINSDGMSFNELKPIYKEFIIKLALILTKDEFYEKCKIIMSKQNKRKKKFNRKTNKKVLNKIIYSKFNKDVNHLFLCGKKKILRKTSICKNSLKRKIAPHHNKVKRKQNLKNREEKNMLLSNDMNTSSGYFSYSECTYDTDSCTCKSADKCYCTRTLSQLGRTISPERNIYNCKQKNMKKPFIHKESKKQNCLNKKQKNKSSLYLTNSYKYQSKRNSSVFDKDIQYSPTNGYEENEKHCYHCSRYKSIKDVHTRIYSDHSNMINDSGIAEMCECDTESCRDSDKCYCNVNNINVLDMLKLQGFAASDSSIDSSFQSNDDSFPIEQNWKRNLLNKYKDKQYIQASKSLEFVQFTNSENGTTDNMINANSDRYDQPSVSSFSYKDVEESSGSSMLDYNLFNKSKQGQNQQRNENHRNYSENQRNTFENPNKFLVVSARDPKGRIVYVGADNNNYSKKKNDANGQTDVISIKKSAEIASLFMKKQNLTSDFNQIRDYIDADSGIRKKINKLENSLGYLP